MRVIYSILVKEPIEKNCAFIFEFCSIRNIRVLKYVANRQNMSCDMDVDLFKKLFKQDPVVGKTVSLKDGFEKIIEEIKVLKIY